MDGTVDSGLLQNGENSPAMETSSAMTPLRLPAILAPERFDRYLDSFMAEYDPRGPTENALVRLMARHLAATEKWSDAAEAVERTTARNLPALVGALPDRDQIGDDALLAGAMATDAAYHCERYSFARSRAFSRMVDKLHELQAIRRTKEVLGRSIMPPSFENEAACETYLLDRLRIEIRRCGKCGETNGCFLPSRKAWECRDCRAQSGIRAGTVMAGSALPLLAWFNTIRLLLWRPTIGTAELAEHVGVRRLTTVRAMAMRIRDGMGADDASARLAGLDQHFARSTDNLNEAVRQESIK